MRARIPQNWVSTAQEGRRVARVGCQSGPGSSCLDRKPPNSTRPPRVLPGVGVAFVAFDAVSSVPGPGDH